MKKAVTEMFGNNGSGSTDRTEIQDDFLVRRAFLLWRWKEKSWGWLALYQTCLAKWYFRG
jgi:hypothetical protein